MAVLLSVLALIVSFGVFAYEVSLNNNRVSDVERLTQQIQESRYRANLYSCQYRNRLNKSIIAFVQKVSVTPKTVALVSRSFPLTKNCPVQARHSVYDKKPQSSP